MMQQWVDAYDFNFLYVQLKTLVLEYYTGLPCSLEEYTVIQKLEQRHCFCGLDKAPFGLAIFAKHFLTRHGFYALQKPLLQGGIALELGLIHIQLLPAASAQQTQLAVGRGTLIAGFYGDINTLRCATESSVNELLSSFWQAYASFLRADDAYTILQLPVNAPWVDIQNAYRRLAAKHHPDKGGLASDFARIQQAYQALKNLRVHIQKPL